MYSHHYNSPLGGMTMTSNGTALTGLWFDEDPEYESLKDTDWPVFEDLEEADRPASESSDSSSTPENPENPSSQPQDSLPVFRDTCRWLDTYFGGEVPDFAPPLEVQDTKFRLEVWDILKTIPYGKSTTYGKIAREIAEKRGMERMSAQAVGNAVGSNPVVIIIPCHRVLGSDGKLTGYSGGIERKRALLELERIL